jgi:hypothetical protein
VGGFEAGLPGSAEPTLKYHPEESGNLTCARDPGEGHCLVGSLTGAVASKKVTEACEGSLSLIGNQA